jgi:lipopolysaccharide biosynthesis glycosyltransferase
MIDKSDTINIALAADSNYIIPITVLLQSIFDNNLGNKIHIYLLHFEGYMSFEDLVFLEEFTLKRNAKFTSLSVREERIEEFPILRHGINTYLRLFLAELLPSIKKILYLDGDIIVRGDLSQLFETDISNYYLAAAKDAMSFYDVNYQKKIGIEAGYIYFNAGVTLLNLDILRKIDPIKKSVKFYSKFYNYIVDSDQAILNHISYPDHVKYISPKYNLNFNIEKDIMYRIANKEEIKKAIRNPTIVHFIGSSKPWSALCIHPYRKEWWKYLRKTKYLDFVPNDHSIKNSVYRLFLWSTRTLEKKFTLKAKQNVGRFIPNKIKVVIKKSMKKIK